jgi:hypothetical protein
MTKRPLDEVYDTIRDVEQDPIGALMAIQQLVAEADTLRAEVERLRDVLRVQGGLLIGNRVERRARIVGQRLLEAAYGNEQVTNGNFTSGMTGWTAYGEADQ